MLSLADFFPLFFNDITPVWFSSYYKPEGVYSGNMVGKGENAGNQHFLLFPQCLHPYKGKFASFEPHLKLSSANAFNLDKATVLLFGKGLLSLYNTILTHNDPVKRAF